MIDLETVQKMWAEDAKIKDSELDESSLQTSILHAKYIKHFALARLALKQRQNNLLIIKKEKWRYFTGKMSQSEMDIRGWTYDPFHGSLKPLKSEINYFLDADEDIQAIQMKIEYAKIVVETLEEILNTLRWRQNTIKNIIEFKKFNAGM